jgi:hypothetical protein
MVSSLGNRATTASALSAVDLLASVIRLHEGVVAGMVLERSERALVGEMASGSIVHTAC